MNASTILGPIKEHPWIVVGGVAAVLLVWQLRGSKSSSASQSTGSAVFTVASDPNLIALQAQQNQNAAQVAMAGIQADVQKSYIGAMQNVQQSAIAEQWQEAQLAANVTTAQIAQSAFSDAVAGISQNYFTQLAANGAANSSLGNIVNGQVIGTAHDGSIGPNDPLWNTVFNGSNWGQSFTLQTGTNPSGSQVINTANTQIEQMFNNILRAGQGQGPLETAIVTEGGTSASVTGKIDPIFLNFSNGNANGIPTITDVTPGANNAWGYTGSVFDPNTGYTFQMQ